MRVMLSSLALLLLPFAAGLHASQRHTVQEGDTLGALSRRYGVSVSEIKAANGLEGDNIVQGRALKIPKGVGATPPAKSAGKPPVQVRRAQPANAGAFLSQPEPSNAASPRTAEKPARRGNGAYTVQPGDSLSKLASRYGTTVEALRRANGLEGDVIGAGDMLLIPAKGSEAATPKAENKPRVSNESAPAPVQKPAGTQHFVAEGDRLSLLAKRYGVTADAIRQANQLDGDFIRIGQRLEIPNKGASDLSAVTPKAKTEHSKPPVSRPTPAETLEAFARATPGAVTRPAAPVWEQPEHYLDLVDLGAPAAKKNTTVAVAANWTPATPAPAAQEEPAPQPQPKKKAGGSHVVEEGDSLWKIARRHKVSVEDLRSANGLKDDNVQIGQKLVLPQS